MGCDYYIDTYLSFKTIEKIYHIHIDRDKGYYFDSYEFDSDEDDYNDKIEQDFKEQMELHKKPDKILFENGKYINKTVEEKYDKLIKNYLNKINFSDIVSIWKSTSVFER